MNVVGAQNSLKQQLLSVTSTINHLSILSLEILALPTQNRAIAEPTNDRILAAFFAINMDACNRGMKVYSKAAIVLKELDDGLVSRQFGTRKILFVPDELTLLAEVGKLVLRYFIFTNILTPSSFYRVDPDILIGYDVKRYSFFK
jgi:hypothetical protein